MSLLPSKPDLVSDSEPRVVGVDSEDADALMSALSSETARRLLSELHAEPAPPAELADRADTTLQNAQYHLANLSEAGAVEVVGTAYSEKGREMDVYAPADQPLVIFAGQEEQASGLRAALSRLVGGVGALLVGSLAVQQVFGDGIGRLVGFGATGGGDGAEPAPRDRGEGGGGPVADGAGTETATATPVDQGTTADGADGAAGGTEAETAEAASPTSGDVSVSDTNASGTVTEGATETSTPAPDAATATPVPEATQTPTPTPEATQVAADGGVDALASLPPGALFFLGGLVVLVVGIALTYGR